MSDEPPGEWQTTTDHDRIRDWAAARGAVPVRTDGPDGEPTLRLETEPESLRGEQISWEQFFERFESRGRVFRYRESSEGPDDDHELVGGGGRESAEQRDDAPSDDEREQIATSDTGEGEPVVFDRTENESATAAGDDSPASPREESERGSVEGANALEVEEIHENSVAPDEWDSTDEYVMLTNASESSIDLSGWTVENEAGRTYRFSDGTTLDPNERLTLHSGPGTDTEDERYWGADEAIWRKRGGTILVTTDRGERVLEESYKGGR